MLVILANCYYLLFIMLTCLVQISPSGPILNDKKNKKQNEAAITLKGVQGGKIL